MGGNWSMNLLGLECSGLKACFKMLKMPRRTGAFFFAHADRSQSDVRKQHSNIWLFQCCFWINVNDMYCPCSPTQISAIAHAHASFTSDSGYHPPVLWWFCQFRRHWWLFNVCRWMCGLWIYIYIYISYYMIVCVFTIIYFYTAYSCIHIIYTYT